MTDKLTSFQTLRPLLLAASILMTFSTAQSDETKTEKNYERAATDPPSIVIKPGREFAADSYVHTPLKPDAPLEEHSADYVADFLRQIKQYYGTVNVNTTKFTPPLFQVGPDQPTVRVRVFDAKKPDWTFKPLQDQWQNVP